MSVSGLPVLCLAQLVAEPTSACPGKGTLPLLLFGLPACGAGAGVGRHRRITFCVLVPPGLPSLYVRLLPHTQQAAAICALHQHTVPATGLLAHMLAQRWW